MAITRDITDFLLCILIIVGATGTFFSGTRDCAVLDAVLSTIVSDRTCRLETIVIIVLVSCLVSGQRLNLTENQI